MRYRILVIIKIYKQKSTPTKYTKCQRGRKQRSKPGWFAGKTDGKTEELTLYMIDLNKKVEALQKENIELKNKLNK